MRTGILAASTLAVLFLGTGNLQAQRPEDRDQNQQREGQSPRGQASTPQQNIQQAGKDGQKEPIVVKRNKEAKHYSREDAVVVSDRQARTVPSMQDEHRINFYGKDYSYSDGHYYKINNGQYTMVEPPHGIRVSRIPADFITLIVESIPYFFFEGVYYRQIVEDKSYEVVVPPMGAIVPELPQYDVKTVVINGRTVLEYDNVLYKAMVTPTGVQYKVVGTLDDTVD